MTIMNDEELLYTKDELAFRAVAREFVHKNIAPVADDVEKKATWPEEEWQTNG